MTNASSTQSSAKTDASLFFPYQQITRTLNAQHIKLQQFGHIDALVDIADDYRQLSSILYICNLSPLATLTQFIAGVLSAIAAGALSKENVNKTLEASEFVAYEINHHQQTGQCHYELIVSRIHELYSLLGSLNAENGDTEADSNDAILDDIKARLKDAHHNKGSSVQDEIFATDISSSQTASDSDDNRLNEYLQLPQFINLAGLEAESTLKTNTLNQTQHRTLLFAWRFGLQKLLQADSNEKVLLTQLQKISQYLQLGAKPQSSDGAAQTPTGTLWYVAKQWLGSLALNETPSPKLYASSLAKLEQLIDSLGHPQQSTQPASDKASSINALTYKLYKKIAQLSQKTPMATKLVESVQQQLRQNRDVLSSALDTLSSFIQPSNCKTADAVATLEQTKAVLAQQALPNVTKQLDYAVDILRSHKNKGNASDASLEEVTTVIKSVCVQVYSTEQQINALLMPKLYGEAALDNKTSPSTESSTAELLKTVDSSVVRQTRVALEAIKHAFSDYLNQKDRSQLRQQNVFNQLIDGFLSIHLFDGVDTAEHLANIFDDIANSESAPNWGVTDNITAALTVLEQLMDKAAQQTFDPLLLEQVNIHLNQAQHLIDEPEQASSDLPIGELVSTGALADTAEPESSVLAKTVDYAVDDTALQISADSPTEDSPVQDGSTQDDATQDSSAKATAITSAPVETTTVPSDTVPIVDESAETVSPALLAVREALTADSFEMDEDIRDIFVEEAAEVLETFAEYLPTWQENPQNLDPLSEIRRGFHTLKGSGRMVGANSIGELAWSVENLLNRVLDNTITANNELVDFIVDTKTLLPELIADFNNQRAPSIDPALTVLQAQNLLKGRPIDAGLTANDEVEESVESTEVATEPSTDADLHTDIDATTNADLDDKNVEAAEIAEPTASQPKPNKTEPVAEPESKTEPESKADDIPEVISSLITSLDLPDDDTDVDADFKEIFIEEAEEVVDDITPLYESWQQAPDDFEPLTTVRRGFHTLKGSGRMVGANHSGELAWAIENMLNRVLDKTIEPNEGLQALVGDVLSAYPSIVNTFERGDNQYPEQMPLWISCAHAYAKKLGDEFDYMSLRQQ